MNRTRTALRSIALASVVGIALVACSNSSTTTTGSGGGYGSGGNGGSSQPTATGQIGSGDVTGVGTVLQDSAGYTLYHLTGESSTTITCTGTCAQTWPPLLAHGGAPTGAAGVTGTFGVVTRPDGTKQVTYNGDPLYTYTGDTAPGQANGNGVQGVWYAETPSGKATSGSSGGSGGGGYGSGGGTGSGGGGGGGGGGYGGGYG